MPGKTVVSCRAVDYRNPFVRNWTASTDGRMPAAGHVQANIASSKCLGSGGMGEIDLVGAVPPKRKPIIRNSLPMNRERYNLGAIVPELGGSARNY